MRGSPETSVQANHKRHKREDVKERKTQEDEEDVLVVSAQPREPGAVW